MKSLKNMEINRSNIFEILKNTDIRPDKDYGQNFLLEPEIAKSIVELADIQEYDRVLEIGPGLGSLTHFIDLKNVNFSVCDIDSKMIDFLKIFYKDRITYINDDIRKVDISTYDKIIGNLPYNITTELVEYLLLFATNADVMVLMIQLEAFNRFYDLSGDNYGAISVLTRLCCDVEKHFVVKPGSFHPVPKCKSVVFTLKRKYQYSNEDLIGTYKLTKSLFLNRRKTIYNNLKNYLGDANKASELLSKLDLDSNLRPENIEPEIYFRMYQLIQK